MITLRLYKNFNKRENSTKQPANTEGSYTDFTCSIKDNSTITHPVIDLAIVSGDPASLGYNYAYIAAYSRYYFVTEWTYSLGIWTCHLTVDVLASYKTSIGNFSPYILRAYDVTAEDPDIPDNHYPAKNNWSSIETNITTPFSWANRSYIIGFISAPAGTINNNSLGSVTYYYATESQVVTIIRHLMDPTFMANNLTDIAAGITEQAVKDFVDPLQYIASLTLFPFEARSSALLPSVKPRIGWYDTTNDSDIPSLIRIDSLTMQFKGDSYKVAIPTNLYASGAGKGFLKFSPYTQYCAYIEPFGAIPIPVDLAVDRSYMYCTYDIDLVTGLCRLSLGTGDGRADLAITNALVGVPIQLSQITVDTVGAITGIAGTVMGTASNLAMGNVTGAISNVVSGIGNAVDALKPQASSTGNNGSILSYNGLNTAKFIMRYVDCVDTDPEEFGYAWPRNISGTLSQLSGYIQCANGDIPLPSGALRSELSEISSYLLRGFFYE